MPLTSGGPGSIVGIATGYGLDGPGIESRWGARFSAPVQTSPGAHPSSCTMGTGSFPGGKEQPGRDTDPSPPSSAIGHERVELYLYSPYGPYGLYRASVPVQGCTLPLLLPDVCLFHWWIFFLVTGKTFSLGAILLKHWIFRISKLLAVRLKEFDCTKFWIGNVVIM